MFIGEACCLIMYFIKIKCFKKPKVEQVEEEETMEVIPLSPGAKAAEKKQLKTNINPLLLAIPASFDICGSTLMFIGLT